MDENKPFKTVKIEYYEEREATMAMERRIKVVTTTEQWVGSVKDPVISTSFVYLQKEMKMNIGDTVVYDDEYGSEKSGTLTAIGSDKDSYDDLKLKDGVFLYKSKKLKKYVPVKPKSMDSIYIEVTGFGGKHHYLLPKEIINSV